MIPAKSQFMSVKTFIKNEIRTSNRILDVGCGSGAMALYLISNLNCHIDGVDMDKGKVHRANEKFQKKQTKGEAICHICDSINIDKQFKENSFDSIL